MPGRKYSSVSSYRYGFNGKENDNEVKGEGNQQDYGLRLYDPRLGIFLSVDPLFKEYPWNSPYTFAENEPIANIDLDGAKKMPYKSPSQLPKIGKTSSYTTKMGAGAQVYTVEESGQKYNITQMTVYEKSIDAFGKVHHFNTYYFAQDKSLVADKNTPTQSGTEFQNAGTNWHFYYSSNNGMSTQGRIGNEGANMLGKMVFGGAAVTAAAFAAPTLFSMSQPYLPTAARYLVPKPGFNPAGGAWDFINQKLFQGKSWGDVNWGTVGTASAFGKGTLLSNSVWGSTGSFTNLSVNNIASGGNTLQLNQQGAVSFGSNVIGNVMSGGTNGFFRNANETIIQNPLKRAIMNRLLSIPTNATGQIITNQVEKAATPRK